MGIFNTYSQLIKDFSVSCGSVPCFIIFIAFSLEYMLDYTYAVDNNELSSKEVQKFNFVAAGDFGCGDEPNRTIEGMTKKSPELTIALGDLSYNKSALCWINAVTPLEINGTVKVTFGGHDLTKKMNKYNDYLRHFNMTKPFYSFNYQNVHFLAMATAKNKVIPYNETSKQYEFVKEDLKRAHENKSINWIIVYSFRTFYSSNTTHPGLDELQDLYHPLFDKYGVDIVLQAHNHNYQRTYPLNYNQTRTFTPIITDKETDKYTHDLKGPIFITVGTGGGLLYDFTGQAPYVITQFKRHGFLNVDIDSSKKEYSLSGTFYENVNMNKQDHFSITKKPIPVNW